MQRSTELGTKRTGKPPLFQLQGGIFTPEIKQRPELDDCSLGSETESVVPEKNLMGFPQRVLGTEDHQRQGNNSGRRPEQHNLDEAKRERRGEEKGKRELEVRRGVEFIEQNEGKEGNKEMNKNLETVIERE